MPIPEPTGDPRTFFLGLRAVSGRLRFSAMMMKLLLRWRSV
jgi:hypothetical protein